MEMEMGKVQRNTPSGGKRTKDQPPFCICNVRADHTEVRRASPRPPLLKYCRFDQAFTRSSHLGNGTGPIVDLHVQNELGLA